MKKYSEFEIEDFLTDEFFVRWVKSPNKDSEHFWAKWMDNNPLKRELVTEAFYLINSINFKDELQISDQEHTDIFEAILAEDKDNNSIVKNRKLKMILSFIAAAMLVFGIVYTGSEWSFLPFTKTSELNWKTSSNPSGQKSKIVLSDGSTVFLNADSHLSYPEEFEKDLRVVELEGEAFFEVSENQSKPFIVRAGGNEIKVLGTSFNVNQEQSISVALVTGKVSINFSNGKVTTLNPNQMAVFRKDGELDISKFDPFEVVGWKDKYLVFKHTSFPELKKKLEKWYGVEIKQTREFSDDWFYTGQYYQESLESVLTGISITSNFSFEIHGKTIVITPNEK